MTLRPCEGPDSRLDRVGESQDDTPGWWAWLLAASPHRFVAIGGEQVTLLTPPDEEWSQHLNLEFWEVMAYTVPFEWRIDNWLGLCAN